MWPINFNFPLDHAPQFVKSPLSSAFLLRLIQSRRSKESLIGCPSLSSLNAKQNEWRLCSINREINYDGGLCKKEITFICPHHHYNWNGWLVGGGCAWRAAINVGQFVGLPDLLLATFASSFVFTSSVENSWKDSEAACWTNNLRTTPTISETVNKWGDRQTGGRDWKVETEDACYLCKYTTTTGSEEFGTVERYLW